MGISKHLFGKTKNGETVTQYTLTNSKGMKAVFLDYGAIIQQLWVPDDKGKMDDVVLGFDSVKDYEEQTEAFGSFIGRNANRIDGASFHLNGVTYELEKNDGQNNLHSGSISYNKYCYEAEYGQEEDSLWIEFSRLSPHMEQGFPGNLDMSVTYTLTEENELQIEYMAVSDQDTIVNVTNHSYFNLKGHNAGSILNHKVLIDADAFTPTREDLIPTGEIRKVENTPLDFRHFKALGEEIEADYEPIRFAGGYDHNFVLNHRAEDEVTLLAEIREESSGRKMQVFTDMLGMQMYTGNFLTGKANGKGGAAYKRRDGVCFETQYFPNACNQENFKSTVLEAGKEFYSVTVYKFCNKETENYFSME